MSPTLTPTQRWAQLPSHDELPLRAEKAVWPAAAVGYIARFVTRQTFHNNNMTEWLRERQQSYTARYAWEETRAWHEAALDLVMWQRQFPHPQDAIAWIVGWEKVAEADFKHLTN